MKKNKKVKELKLVETLRKQADEKNKFECSNILNELNEASLNGEYVKYATLKVNQIHYFRKLGLSVSETDRSNIYKISWENEE